MQKSKNAFTMIELIFVIVVLGILAAVALPKFAATRTDAQISKARADIASIRSSIVTERQSRLIVGDSSWIPSLSSTGTNLFMGHDANRTLLMYGVASGGWANTATTADVVDTYTFTLESVTNTFNYYPVETTVGAITYQAGTFNCTAGTDCSKLTD